MILLQEQLVLPVAAARTGTGKQIPAPVTQELVVTVAVLLMS